MSPLEFSIRILRIRPYGWQAEAMQAVSLGKLVSVVAANGSGKTANLVAPLILWFLWTYPQGQVVFTSGSFRQIEKQLWPAIKRFRRRFPRWNFMTTELRTPEGGFAIGFSTDDAGTAEGWHPKINGETDPVFIIIDEAKTVPNDIFEAFDRCTRKFQLWVSSPGAPRGQFFDSFGKNKKHHWIRRAPSKECPHIPAEKRERDLEKYGPDHPLYRSMHDAEFTEDEELLVLSGPKLTKALDRQPPQNPNGETVAFCDFAAGGDENTLSIRRGNVARLKKAWVEKDTVQACREFIRLFEEEKLKPHEIWGDADGLGTAMIDMLAEMGWPINRFHGGQSATEPDEYENLISEVWFFAAMEIERGRINVGVLDPKSFEQATTRKSEWGEKGKLRIQSKKKMKLMGIKSPDRIDSLFGCIFCGARMTGAMTASSVDSMIVAASPFAVPHIRF